MRERVSLALAALLARAASRTLAADHPQSA
jgi:hypothetical protein